jgi:hypothetical protein
LVQGGPEHLQDKADTQLQKEQMAQIAYLAVILLSAAERLEHHTTRLVTVLEIVAVREEAALVITTV